LEQALFRQEVIDARRGEWLGHVRLATPVSHALWTAASLAIGALIVTWLWVGHYTRRERVSGSLVPQAGLIDLTAHAAGTVTAVTVREGMHVHAGGPLVALSGERVSVSLGETAAAISTQLRAERARLHADLIDTQTSSDQQALALHAQQALLQTQVRQLDAQLAIQRQQSHSAEALLEKIQPLRAKGYISEFQVQQQQSTALDAQAQVKALARQRTQVLQQLATARAQMTQLPLDTHAKLHALKDQLAQVAQSLAQNEAQRASVLRAPKDGTVSSVLVKNGQTVSPGQPLLAIVPTGTPLEAQLLVPSSAISFVHKGAAVSLRYQAFPYQKFGLQQGRVVEVSRNALSPAEITALVGQTPPQPLYRVEVALERQAIRAYGTAQTLKAGMALDADILLDRRRLLEWVFEPLFGIDKRFAASSS
jgi:membrane fusion protein